MNAPLSTILTALAEQLAAGLEGKPVPTPAALYSTVIRARDEAVCLEARAGTRDVAVHRLLSQVTTIVEEAARFEKLVEQAASDRRARATERSTIQ